MKLALVGGESRLQGVKGQGVREARGLKKQPRVLQLSKKISVYELSVMDSPEAPVSVALLSWQPALGGGGGAHDFRQHYPCSLQYVYSYAQYFALLKYGRAETKH